MSSPDGSDGEMPVFPDPRRAGDRTVPDGVALDRLLAGLRPGGDAAVDVSALADVLAAAAGPATERELAGEADLVAAFVEQREHWATPTRSRPMLATLLSAKLAAAVAAGTLGLGGVAAAAYTGALPEPVQDFAHRTVGAPSAAADHTTGGDQAAPSQSGNAEHGSSSEPAGQPVGPDATAAAMYGLCQAFAGEKAETGKVDSASVAFQALAEAAGGPDKIDEFCSSAMPPGEGTSPPAADPSRATPSHPTGGPTPLPSGGPTDPPAPPTPVHPTGQPTSG